MQHTAPAYGAGDVFTLTSLVHSTETRGHPYKNFFIVTAFTSAYTNNE